MKCTKHPDREAKMKAFGDNLCQECMDDYDKTDTFWEARGYNSGTFERQLREETLSWYQGRNINPDSYQTSG